MSSTPAASHTRATRSRFSSPQISTNGATDSSSRTQGSGNGGGANGTERQKTFMQQWLEPAVQVKASYQDAGFVRHGLFENMAPLGTMPKVGVFKKTAPPPAKAPEQPQVRKIVLKQKPAVPPPPPVEEETVGDETEDADSVSTDEIEDQEVEEHHEAAKGSATTKDHKARTALATQRRRRSVASVETEDEDWAPAAPAQKGTRRRSLSRASSQWLQQRTGSAGAGAPQADRKAFVDKVVEVAVDEALAHFRYPTAWALRTLYDENSSNEEFLDMVEKVFLQTANADTLEEFARLLQARKREGRKKDQACSYFVPPSNNSRSVQPPKRAPYGSLVKFDLTTLRLDRGPSEQQKPLRPAKAPEPEPEPERESKPEAEGAPLRKKRKLGRQHSETSSSSSKMTSTNGASSKAKTETPSRRRTRERSTSSTSSLSSARSLSPPDGIQADGEGGEFEGFDDPPSRASPEPAQPITATRRRRSNAPRKSRNVSPSRPSSAASTPAPQLQAAAAAPSLQTAPSQRQTPADEQPTPETEEQPYEMPAVVDSPLFPNLGTKRGGKSQAGTPVQALPSTVGKLDPTDPKLRLRQNARKVTNKPLPTSNVRERVPQAGRQQEEAEEPVTPAPASTAAASSRPRVSLPSARQTPAAREGRSTRSALRRAYDDLEEQASPTTAHFPGSEAASTVADSRAGTPGLRAAKKPRTGLRVKNSPVKKKNGTAAGIPRPSGERSSPVGNSMTGREDDNDDYCSACGGSGQLICCDGCTRSFHLTCADPVLMQDAMPVEWFCNVCRANRDPAALPAHSGAFALLQEKLDVRNSSAFRLPPSVRDLFEGVRTGTDGEYEEFVAPVKPNRKRKYEEDQVPDLFRVRDAEGKAVICHGCQKSSSPDRAIIPCSGCGIFWHLDCLDPPLANPPLLRTWKCPLHADEILPKLVALGPAHKYRKVRHAPVIRPAFSRGYVNNGYIDVQLEDSDDESGWRDFETFGRTVRLPEKGIKLDFLSRTRGHGKAKPIAPQDPKAVPAPAPIEQRSLEEQQAALNLVQLSRDQGQGISTLIDAMIAQADPTVIDLMARVDPNRLESGQLNQMDHQVLRAILASAESMTQHIRRLLGSNTPNQPRPQANGSAETEDGPAMVLSLTNSVSTESDNPARTDRNPGALELDGAKSPASPTTTDDVPAMTQGEKTPVQGDQSPAAPLPLEESGPIVNGSMPALPTKTSSISADEPVVVEANGDGEKTLGEGPDGAPIELE
ncbi:hypothetical protein C8A03DRAFT_14636 [Achaetomium macrosporum]|uniref:PHD-type domain-containing protein n=1 Tax=Achaetomium macrosporum TaxID=79813 RepID=A0AAN7HEJ8_9PEZI|nr:hypothetical protein C8A03DRAFT_14636 [Achaetomium macrosporum]